MSESRIMDMRALRQSVPDHELDAEFNSIPLCEAHMSDLPNNTPEERQQARSKCRYTNVLPNPDTRVILSTPESPFINANWVPSLCENKRYIATQGPTPNSVGDFWQMVWDTDSCCIVMATGLMEMGRRKCERYWPTEEEPMGTFGAFTVTMGTSVDCGEYIQTKLDVAPTASPGTVRTVAHFWYTGWPDHGAPDTAGSVLELLHSVRNSLPPKEANIVVHCSAGIGRTGTFMAIDMGMDQLDQEWRVTDILQNVTNMRKHRGQSIQTAVQYRFVYKALKEYVTLGPETSIFGTNKPRTVTLTKNAQEFWGFTLRGSYPPFVVEIDALGLAARNGVEIGDHIISINGQDTWERSHRESVQLIKASSERLVLGLVSKRKTPV